MSSTRDSILTALRQEPMTIRALTKKLGVTRTAIVVQINQLLADHLIQKGAMSPEKSVGKPAVLYEAVPGQEDSLSEAYRPFSELLISVLSEGLSDDAFDHLMRRLGREMAAPLLTNTDLPFEDRLAKARVHADHLGGATRLQKSADGLVIESHNCPVGSLVRSNKCVCTAIGQFFETATGHPVDVQCNRTDRLTCRFLVSSKAL